MTPEIVGKSTSRGLTDEQAIATTCMDPRVVVKAGPGSGKTGILCGHVKYMMIPREFQGRIATPEQIIAIAYNRKAAYEIKSRLHGNDPTVGWNKAQVIDRPPFIGTHHSFLLWLCYRYRVFLGYAPSIQRITYLDDAKTQRLRDICKTEALHNPERPDDTNYALNLSDTIIEQRTQEIFLQRCKFNGYANYDMLLRSTVQILQDAECYADLEKAKFYLLIDEAQDLGNDEFTIYDAFPAVQKYIVGDPAQAITPIPEGASLLTRFEKKPGSKLLELTQNFRSFQPLCTVAYQLINNHKPNLRVAKQKSVRTAAYPDAPMVIQWRCMDEQDQMDHLARIIKYYAEGVNKQLIYSQVAILYRTIAEGRHIQAFLDTKKIPTREEDPHSSKAGAAPNDNKVTLARITQIKGMEYANVIIPFFHNHIWPGQDDINFSRRLLYTGITRAENTAHLLFHEHNGQRDPLGALDPARGVPCRVSRFLAEMSTPDLVIHAKASASVEEASRS